MGCCFLYRLVLIAPKDESVFSEEAASAGQLVTHLLRLFVNLPARPQP